MITLNDIELARERIKGSVYCSPFPRSQTLSQMLGAHVYLKLENLQMTGSFKERGANNKLLCLEHKDRGVTAMSAGNHAQAVAYQAKQLGIAATIVMPENTALVKVSATRALGAEVILHGTNLEEAFHEASRLATERNLTFVHPYNDPEIIAGQGTVALELLDQVPNLDAVVVSVGGGGLISGVALALKEKKPGIKVYGVEPSSIPSMHQALQSGHPVRVEAKKTIADGTAVLKVGDLTYEIVKKYVDDVVSVDEEAIAQAILLLLEREKTVAEGAGALPLAALKQKLLPIAGKHVGLIISGGNIDVNLIARIIDRGLLASGRQMRLKVRVSDQPGSLAGILEIVSAQGGNILHVYHDRVSPRVPLGQTAIELQIETRGFEHIERIENAIRAANFDVV